MPKKQKQVKLKAGTKVCFIDSFPNAKIKPFNTFYGTVTKDVKKGFPAIVRVESHKLNSQLLKYPINNQINILAIKPTRLRKCTKEDLLRIAIEKMKGDNDGRGEIA